MIVKMKKALTLALMFALTVGAMAQEVKKYDIKSGIVKSVTTMMGQKTEAVQYFDNFGATETSKTKMNIPGAGEVEIATISKDGKNYVVNYTSKQVQEVPAQASINYLALDDETIAQYKIKEIGKETVAEKECIKYSEQISQMGQTFDATVCVWKGVPMKSVIKAGGMEIVTEVTEITENAFILPQTFEVPTF